MTANDETLVCCAHGCGFFCHIKCIKVMTRKFICKNCEAKQITGNSTMVLRRIAELTNIVLAQSKTLQELRADSAMAKTEIAQIAQGQTAIRTELGHAVQRNEATASSNAESLDKLHALVSTSTSRPVQHRHRRLPISEIADTFEAGLQSADMLTVPVVPLRGRSASPKRRRMDSVHPEFLIGNASEEDHAVPAVPKPETRRIFISRVVPNFPAEKLHASVQNRLKNDLTVIRLKTERSYSSFVLYVSVDDEKTVMSPSFWVKGTFIKNFRGKLFPEQIHSKFGRCEKAADPATDPVRPLTSSPFPNDPPFPNVVTSGLSIQEEEEL